MTAISIFPRESQFWKDTLKIWNLWHTSTGTIVLYRISSRPDSVEIEFLAQNEFVYPLEETSPVILRQVHKYSFWVQYAASLAPMT